MAAAAAVRERNTGFLGSSAFSSLPRADAVLRVRAAFVRSPNAARLRVPSTPDAAELLPAMPVPVPLAKEFGRPDASDAPVMETGALTWLWMHGMHGHFHLSSCCPGLCLPKSHSVFGQELAVPAGVCVWLVLVQRTRANVYAIWVPEVR